MAKYKQTSLLPYPPPSPPPVCGTHKSFGKFLAVPWPKQEGTGGTRRSHWGLWERRKEGGERRIVAEKPGKETIKKKKTLTVLAVGERDPLGRQGPLRSGIIIKGYPGYGGPLNNPPSCLFAANMAGKRGARRKIKEGKSQLEIVFTHQKSNENFNVLESTEKAGEFHSRLLPTKGGETKGGCKREKATYLPLNFLWIYL